MSRFDDDLRHAAEQLAREPLPADILDEALDATDGGGLLPRAIAAVAAVLVVIVGGLAAMNLPRPVASDAQSSAPSADVEPSASVSAAASTPPLRREIVDDGVRLTVELETARARAGEPVLLTATVENLGAEPVYWLEGCGTRVGVRAERTPPLSEGRAWAGDPAELKGQLVREGGDGVFGNPGRGPDGETHVFFDPCPLVRMAPVALEPGARVTERLGWIPTGPQGMPLPSGTYEVTATFARVGDAGIDADSDTSRHVTLSWELDVDGDDGHLTPGEAADVILADDRLWQLLDGVRPERWIVPELTYEDGRWEMWLPVGRPSAWLEFDFGIVAKVDARTGELLELAVTDDEHADPSRPPVP